jgi:hypothetical protein
MSDHECDDSRVGPIPVEHSRARMLPHEVRERRRSRRLCPGAIAISLLMVLGAVTVANSGTASAGGTTTNGIPPPPTCNPEMGFSSSVSTSPTNATITYEPLVNSGCPTTVYVTLTWGNTTSYVFTAFSVVKETASHYYSIFLNYLEPGTTYYFQLHGNGTGLTADNYDSFWTTSAESTYINSYGYYISGTVYDAANPSQTAPANTIVEAWCLANPNIWYAWGYTNSKGQYSLDVQQGSGSWECQQWGNTGGEQAYVVSFGYDQGGYWLGHWNESIVVWAPQVVNFYLPENFLGLTMVNYGLFTNSADVTLEFCQETTNSFSYTTSTSTTVGALGLSGTYTSAVEVGGSWGSQLCSSTVGQPSDEEWGSWYTTGMLVVNNIGSRAVTDLWQEYYGGKYGGGLGSGGPLSNPVSEPTSNAAACFTEGVHWYHQQIGPSSNEYIQIGASGSISQLGSDVFSFNLGGLLAPLVDVPGIGETASTIGSMITASSTWDYSWSTSLSDGFYVSADIITGSTGGVFTAACQGSGTSGQGLAIEVWQDS